MQRMQVGITGNLFLSHTFHTVVYDTKELENMTKERLDQMIPRETLGFRVRDNEKLLHIIRHNEETLSVKFEDNAIDMVEIYDECLCQLKSKFPDYSLEN